MTPANKQYDNHCLSIIIVKLSVINFQIANPNSKYNRLITSASFFRELLMGVYPSRQAVSRRFCKEVRPQSLVLAMIINNQQSVF
jgi:hypothetical protein